MKAKKLIEVALPIKEISAESVRDKSIRHGHISTLHLWWARRPLPVCRAIIFSSLVPDPLDEHCPTSFCEAVDKLLCTNPIYKTYPDIPYTAIFDPMPDNKRNRLLMFIGKFSPLCQQNMLAGKNTPSKDQIQDGCLIKWESKNDERVLTIARKLIWIAYNGERNPNCTYEVMSQSFDEAYAAIKEAEVELYQTKNRHLRTAEVKEKEEALQTAIDNFCNNMPSVFDPFAGGGAIPLEAARLGCRSYGNDINPVAHIIEKGSVEYPQKYGKPITYSHNQFLSQYGPDGIKLYGEKFGVLPTDNFVIPNRLSFDVEYYAKKLLSVTESEVAELYPTSGDKEKPIAYYWARTAKCSNPSCNAEIPLLKQFYLVNKGKRQVYLNPIIENRTINFEIKKGKYDENILKGWNNRCVLTCPCCQSVTTTEQLKEQFKSGKTGLRLLAVVEDKNGKSYRIPNDVELNAKDVEINENIRPTESLEIGNKRNFNTPSWGISTFGKLFSNRQLAILNNLIDNFKKIFNDNSLDVEYSKCLQIYLSIFINRITPRFNMFTLWNTKAETLEHIFGRQAIPMTFDFPDANIFGNKTGSAINQIEWITRYIENESFSPFYATLKNSTSGEKSQFNNKFLTAVITDPPYYDAIAYADISDFFYIWYKRLLGDTFPLLFATPLTPKSEECTALKHHHNNSEEKAKKHFEEKLTQIFDAIEMQTSDIVSIMFAHQGTEAWTTLCNSILGSRMNITGSWPMDSERSGAGVKAQMAYLESSVTVACRPSERKGFGDYKEVKKDIQNKVSQEVESLYELGFRGADLLTACFGQAVSEFGRYKIVEKADGSEVLVGELLEMARNAAFDALLKGVQGDDYTKFYIGWLQLNGTGDTDYDDATKFTRVGVNVDINDIKHKRLLIQEGNKMHIAMAKEHLTSSSVEGTKETDNLITQAHRAILLYRQSDRGQILSFVRDVAPESTSPLWRLLTTLKELLPAGDDFKDVQGLLQNAEDFRLNCHKEIEYTQRDLFEDSWDNNTSN